MEDQDIPKDRVELILNTDIVAKIDTLIEEGLYPNRITFLEQAIQAQLQIHQDTFEKYENEKNFVIGIIRYSAKELERIVAQDKRLDIKAIGFLSFSDDITPELFNRAVRKITFAGRIRAPRNLLPLVNQRRFTLLGRSFGDFRQLAGTEN